MSLRSHAGASDAAPATVHALLAQRAAQSADAVFAIDASDGSRLSYAALQSRATAVARACAALGVAAGDRVAMLLDNRLATAEVLLGAMAGGFVPVPLNPNGGAAYLEQVLAHCDATLVVASAGYLELLEPARCGAAAPQVLEIDGLLRQDPGARSGAPGAPQRDHPALLIYTSGTTGQPRGASFSQAQILACADNMGRSLGLDASDRFLCAVPLSHLNGFEKLLSVCWTGGSIVLPGPFRAGEFWELLTRHRCTWVSLVPTIVRQLLQHAERHPPPPPAALAHVRFARSSSAPLPPADHIAFEARFGLVLAEGMGMTEAGSIFQNPPSRSARKIGSLGLPCGFEVRLLGADGAPVADGEVGEIAVRGASLMTGYYKDPEATAAARTADGWLRTGDRAHRDADGYYFHAGRATELIIKGGVNIAPAEIDVAVGAHPGVLAAAAVGVPDPYFGQDVALFVVARPGAGLSEATLRAFCEQRLGAFKAPARITFVDDLPRDAAGKVQRYRLGGA
ncbi:MAG: class I adenylate-forming enzyme family protein, partial [Candidatus Binatia bacterium]